MASFTWSIPGDATVANELRRRLNEVGAQWGYAALRGESAGSGGGVRMLRDVAEGGAVVFPLPELASDRAELLAAIEEMADSSTSVGVKQLVRGLEIAEELRAAGPVKV